MCFSLFSHATITRILRLSPRRSYNLKNQFNDATRTAQSKSNFFLAKRSLPAVTRSLSLRIQPGTRLVRTLQSRRRDTAEEEAGQDKAYTGGRQPRKRKRKKGRRERRAWKEGRVVPTDLGRCNFREDPLRRWAQLVGALTRPLSHPARFTPCHPISAHLSRRPSSSLVSHDFTCEFNLPFS